MVLKKFNEAINTVLRYILTCFMAVMIAAVVWQVFTRFILKDPSSFTDELSRYLLIWIGILGGAYTFSIKRHLALELLASRLSKKGQLIQSIVVNLIILAFAGVVLLYGGYILVAQTLLHGQVSPGISLFGHQLLIGYVYLVVPFAGIIIFYFGLVDIYESLKKIISPSIAIEE